MSQDRTVELRDGTHVVLTTMHPTDADRLVRFHHTLSDRTTYLRFFSPHPELSAREVQWFTDVDHTDREAVIAVVDDEIVGVARFDRLEPGTDAEVAFVVADSWQGRGLGTILFHHLVTIAREHGVTRFVAETLAQNQRMLSLFRHAGHPLTVRVEDAMAHVTIDLMDHQLPP